MRPHRNSNTEIPEQKKKSHQLNQDMFNYTTWVKLIYRHEEHGRLCWGWSSENCVSARELCQLEAKLKKWEDELKMKVARISDVTSEMKKKLDDYLQRAEARTIEL